MHTARSTGRASRDRCARSRPRFARDSKKSSSRRNVPRCVTHSLAPLSFASSRTGSRASALLNAEPCGLFAAVSLTTWGHSRRVRGSFVENREQSWLRSSFMSSNERQLSLFESEPAAEPSQPRPEPAASTALSERVVEPMADDSELEALIVLGISSDVARPRRLRR
jgi:hypothetical protein